MHRSLATIIGSILALAPIASFGGTIYTNQATASVPLPIYVNFDVASGVVAVVPAGTKLTLETGPYGPANDWWYGRVNGAATTGLIAGWFKKQQITRTAKTIPDGNRWADVTIDDAGKLYQIRLLVGTTVVDLMNIAVGAPVSPSPAGIFKTIYREPHLFELPAHPGVYLQWWQTIRPPIGPGTLAIGLHTWILDSRGFPTRMEQYGRISNGCTRIPRAMDVFNFLPLRSTVQIHYSPWKGPTTSLLLAVKMNTDNANVRSTNSTSGTILGQVQSGQIYVSDRQSQGWYRIRYDNRDGWIWGVLGAKTSAATIRVAYPELNVRTGPGTRYAITGKAYAGYRYGVAGSTTGWTKIWYRGKTRWVYSASVFRSAM